MFWGTHWGATVLGPHGQGSELDRGLQTPEHRQPGDLSKAVVQPLLLAVRGVLEEVRDTPVPKGSAAALRSPDPMGPRLSRLA